jgi:hypothetical protein
MGRRFARVMDGLDGGLSTQRMACGRGLSALLLMLQQFMSRIAIFPFGSRPYSCRAFTANSRKARSNGGGQSTPWVTDFRGVEDFRLIAPCSLTLIYCSLINRLTLAAAFAAAFFMGGGFVMPARFTRYLKQVLQDISCNCIRNIFLRRGQSRLYSRLIETPLKFMCKSPHASQTHYFSFSCKFKRHDKTVGSACTPTKPTS